MISLLLRDRYINALYWLVMPTYDKDESKLLEFKESTAGGYASLIRECIGFANSSGGSLIIGVRDHDKELLGVSAETIDKFLEDFPHSIHQAVEPTIIPVIKVINTGKVHLIEIVIPLGMNKPYFLKSSGFPGGVYIRSGRSTIKAKPEHVREMESLNDTTSLDARPIDVSPTILSNRSLDSIYGEHVTEGTLLGDKVLVQTTMGSLHPTRAAILMFCDRPDTHLPESIIIVSHFSGTKGRDIIRTSELFGPIPELVDKALSLVQAWTEMNFKLRGAVLTGVSSVPNVALREILINSLIHRKYSIVGAVKVAIFEDRLEVFSPGDLPPGIRLEDLGNGSTDLRNPLLAKFARKFRLMEKLGSGIRIARDACLEASLAPPTFIEGANHLKTVFNFENKYSEAVNPRMIAKEIIETKEMIQKKDLVERGVRDRTASKTLSDLVSEGYLIKIGNGRSTKYLRCKNELG